MGGRNLRAAGVKTVVDSEKFACLNGFNLLQLGWRSLWAGFAMLCLLLRWRPELLIIVDYPDFNLRLARIAALVLRIPVLYFIPAKVWAWRPGRVKTIKKTIGATGLIFPFEREFYESRGYYNSVFVGHPLADSTALKSPRATQQEKEVFLGSLSLDASKPVVAVLPGNLARLIAPTVDAAIGKKVTLRLGGAVKIGQTRIAGSGTPREYAMTVVGVFDERNTSQTSVRIALDDAIVAAAENRGLAPDDMRRMTGYSGVSLEAMVPRSHDCQSGGTRLPSLAPS
jgi:hypothetical protein